MQIPLPRPRPAQSHTDPRPRPAQSHTDQRLLVERPQAAAAAATDRADQNPVRFAIQNLNFGIFEHGTAADEPKAHRSVDLNSDSTQSLKITRIEFIPADAAGSELFSVVCNDEEGEEPLEPGGCLDFSLWFASDCAPVGYHSKILQATLQSPESSPGSSTSVPVRVRLKIEALVLPSSATEFMNPHAIPFYPQSLKRLLDTSAALLNLGIMQLNMPPSFAAAQACSAKTTEQEAAALARDTNGYWGYMAAPPVDDTKAAPPRYGRSGKKKKGAIDKEISWNKQVSWSHTGPDPISAARERLSRALDLEKEQMLQDMKSFDQYHCSFATAPQTVSVSDSIGRTKRWVVAALAVPGLAEKRPELMFGDFVRIRYADPRFSSLIEFTATITGTSKNTVILQLPHEATLPLGIPQPHQTPFSEHQPSVEILATSALGQSGVLWTVSSLVEQCESNPALRFHCRFVSSTLEDSYKWQMFAVHHVLRHLGDELHGSHLKNPEQCITWFRNQTLNKHMLFCPDCGEHFSDIGLLSKHRNEEAGKNIRQADPDHWRTTWHKNHSRIIRHDNDRKGTVLDDYNTAFIWGVGTVDKSQLPALDVHSKNDLHDDNTLEAHGAMMQSLLDETAANETETTLLASESEVADGSQAGVASGTSADQLNFEQRQAVADIAHGDMSCKAHFARNFGSFLGRLPEFRNSAGPFGARIRPLNTIYIVHGPPGTGKTSVVTHAACEVVEQHMHEHQAVRSCNKARVLVVAPSHAAADVASHRIAQRLGNERVLRIFPYQRAVSMVPEQVMPLTRMEENPNSDADPRFRCPTHQEILDANVVVTTCVTATLLVQLFWNEVILQPQPDGIFSHILIDEAGQATEPEVYCALMLATPNTTISLIGDHRQLGPVVRNQKARQDLGLGTCLMERLLSTNMYQSSRGAYIRPRPVSTTRLLQNYRSHPELLALPSERFYNNTLQPRANAALVNSLTEWQQLPNKKNCPLMFYGVAGVHQRDATSLSFYNLAEAVKLVELIEALLKTDLCSVGDIGVIAPFRKQVYVIRTLLRQQHLGSVRVGTVDDYQGQEEKVVFVSCVVGRNLNSEADDEINGAMSRIGLLGSDTRFNVCMTRAKALLVVLGDPLALQFDNNFEHLLRHCVAKKAYSGCFNPLEPDYEDGDDVEQAAQRMAELMLGPAHYELMFPDEMNDVGVYYRDEMEFRVNL